MTQSLPNHVYMLAGQNGGLMTNNASFKFTFPTIVDLLDQANVSWAYYAGEHSMTNGWNPLPSSVTYTKAHPNMAGLHETSDFQYDVSKPNFPSVAWLMPPSDEQSEHPPYNVTAGQLNVVGYINDIMRSPSWPSSVIILTWDDYGGWYDHAVPAQLDQYGLGFRVPTLIISPYARQGFIDHTLSEHSSTIKLIETVFHLPSLGTRDVASSNLLEALNFQQQPRHALVLPGAFIPNRYPLEYPNGTQLGPLPAGMPGQVYVYDPWPDIEHTTALLVGVSALVFFLAAISIMAKPREAPGQTGGPPPSPPSIP